MEKVIIILLLGFSNSTFIFSQSVGIGTAAPNSSAQLDITSTSKGFLLPRMSTAAITSISNPAKGLLVLDTSKNQLMVNIGTAGSPNWQTIVFKSGWSLTGNSNVDTAINFVGTIDARPLMFKVNNTRAGLIVPTNLNTSYGLNSFIFNTTGTDNTANGYAALYHNTTGNLNTASGSEALSNNTTGSYNTASGSDALNSNGAGDYNTAVGYTALTANSSGTYNSAFGASALHSNTSGGQNTGSGYEALYSNTTGGLNTGTGYDALYSNTTGGWNTATGVQALYTNTTGSDNTATGHKALYANTTGYNNTATGVIALSNNTTGYFNTANGNGALSINTTGTYNTANGYLALYNNNGDDNTANGSHSLYFNTSGFGNTANGTHALFSNTTGSSNTANGGQALYHNSSGGLNTADGANALYQNTIGFSNTANGAAALLDNNTGNYNTANGEAALAYNTTGSNNIAIGYTSGPCYGFTNLNNTIVLGANTCAQNDNYAILSTPTTVWNGGHVAWSTYSDGRIKRNIKEDVPGLTFIMKLRPVTYNRNLEDEISITGTDTRDYPTKHDVEKMRFTGFVAQEVEKAAQESNYDFSGVTKPKTSTDLYSLSYESFVVPLVKAVQEQQVIIEKQQQKIDDLETRMQAIEKLINNQ